MKGRSGTTVFIVVAIAVVVVAVVAGLTMLPSPSEERSRRLDERRVEDLRGINRAVDLYWTRHGRLPPSMEDLARESGVTVSVRDPGSAQDYEFRVLDAETYELCASFEHPSAVSRESASLAQDVIKGFWSHGVGTQCFRLEAQDVPARQETNQVAS